MRICRRQGIPTGRRTDFFYICSCFGWSLFLAFVGFVFSWWGGATGLGEQDWHRVGGRNQRGEVNPFISQKWIKLVGFYSYWKIVQNIIHQSMKKWFMGMIKMLLGWQWGWNWKCYFSLSLLWGNECWIQ
jgi:hypothetical protein